jgi:hypothetical protein
MSINFGLFSSYSLLSLPAKGPTMVEDEQIFSPLEGGRVCTIISGCGLGSKNGDDTWRCLSLEKIPAEKGSGQRWEENLLGETRSWGQSERVR